jgi:hypothetical protein
MLEVPLRPVPSQIISVSLENQNCEITVQQRTYGVYFNLSVNDTLIIAGVIGLNANKIVRSVYLGFVGDITFLDTQGASDPDYTGLGDRFILAYLEASEL